MPGKDSNKKPEVKKNMEFAIGNIGIGTSTPCLRAYIDLTAGKGKISKAHLRKSNKNPEKLMIDKSGNVGIGFSAPSVESC